MYIIILSYNVSDQLISLPVCSVKDEIAVLITDAIYASTDYSLLLEKTSYMFAQCPVTRQHYNEAMPTWHYSTLWSSCFFMFCCRNVAMGTSTAAARVSALLSAFAPLLVRDQHIYLSYRLPSSYFNWDLISSEYTSFKYWNNVPILNLLYSTANRPPISSIWNNGWFGLGSCCCLPHSTRDSQPTN